MSKNKKDVTEQKEPEVTEPETAPETSENSSKKRRALVVYLSIIFAAAFLLVAVSLVVRIHAMKDDFNEANDQADASYAALENQNQASELLALAQNAYYKENIGEFHQYMTQLEGHADTLSEDMQKIYKDLQKIEGELK